jgi:hypothetical protein
MRWPSRATAVATIAATPTSTSPYSAETLPVSLLICRLLTADVSSPPQARLSDIAGADGNRALEEVVGLGVAAQMHPTPAAVKMEPRFGDVSRCVVVHLRPVDVSGVVAIWPVGVHALGHVDDFAMYELVDGSCPTVITGDSERNQ